MFVLSFCVSMATSNSSFARFFQNWGSFSAVSNLGRISKTIHSFDNLNWNSRNSPSLLAEMKLAANNKQVHIIGNRQSIREVSWCTVTTVPTITSLEISRNGWRTNKNMTLLTTVMNLVRAIRNALRINWAWQKTISSECQWTCIERSPYASLWVDRKCHVYLTQLSRCFP